MSDAQPFFVFEYFGIFVMKWNVGVYAILMIDKVLQTCMSSWFTPTLSKGAAFLARSILNKDKCEIIKERIWLLLISSKEIKMCGFKVLKFDCNTKET